MGFSQFIITIFPCYFPADGLCIYLCFYFQHKFLIAGGTGNLLPVLRSNKWSCATVHRLGSLGPQSYQSKILKVLLGAYQEELPQVWRAFTNIWCETDLKALCLPFVQNNDISPLAALTDLHILDHSNTRVIDAVVLDLYKVLPVCRILSYQTTV